MKFQQYDFLNNDNTNWYGNIERGNSQAPPIDEELQTINDFFKKEESVLSRASKLFVQGQVVNPKYTHMHTYKQQ